MKQGTVNLQKIWSFKDTKSEQKFTSREERKRERKKEREGRRIFHYSLSRCCGLFYGVGKI